MKTQFVPDSWQESGTNCLADFSMTQKEEGSMVSPTAGPIEPDRFDDAPRRSGKKKKNGGKGRWKPVLFVGLGCGVLLLGVFCVTGGVLLWVFVIHSAPPEQVLVGRWVLDPEATIQLQPPNLQKKMPRGREGEFLTLDFKAGVVFGRHAQQGGARRNGRCSAARATPSRWR
jgi:hypothetical protein